jgi:hypothetical protein
MVMRPLLVLALLAGTARADEVDDAVEDLRLDDALVLLDRAWTHGGSDVERATAIALRGGDLAATIGDGAAAARWFTLAAALDPDAALPPGTSPKVTEMHETARRALGGRRFGARTRFVRGGLRVEIDDPLAVIATVRLRTARRLRSAQVEGTGAPVRFQHVATAADVELIDGYGNILWAGHVAAPVVLEQPVAAPPERSWVARWQTWAIGGGALAATAGALAFVSLGARSDLEALHRDSDGHEATEALAIERRMQRSAIAAQIAGVAALAAGVTSVVLWRSERDARVVPLAGEGSAGLAVEGSF